MSVVYALATPPAKSAICVFRVSGEGCLRALEPLFKKAPSEHGFFCVRNMYLNNEIIDSVGLISFKGPKSYTGEDSFEVYGHGGLGVMSLMMDAFRSVGFEEAGPGEFTKRAFLNDKLSLNESESVLDVINSTSSKEVFLASQSLSGKFTKEVFGISEKIDSIRMRVEAEIDFSDEGEVFLDDLLISDLRLLIERLEVFIRGCYNKKELGSKKTVLFIGPPNSGKSSVFNRLLGFERALVSDVAGTTRDLIESEVFYNDLSFSVIDSAGIRSTTDKIESRGIDFTVDGINDADVVVAVFENNKLDLLNELDHKLKTKKVISVLNKIDLGELVDDVFDSRVSAKTGEGFDRLKNLIRDAFGENYKKDSVYLVRDRHIKLFGICLAGLNKALKILQNNKEMEIAAEELKHSRSCLDDLVGRKTSDDVLGDIFSSFCIGK
jgi:tRNA modification GTPase